MPGFETAPFETDKQLPGLTSRLGSAAEGSPEESDDIGVLWCHLQGCPAILQAMNNQRDNSMHQHWSARLASSTFHFCSYKYFLSKWLHCFTSLLCYWHHVTMSYVILTRLSCIAWNFPEGCADFL
jgi:hypothetical protein